MVTICLPEALFFKLGTGTVPLGTRPSAGRGRGAAGGQWCCSSLEEQEFLSQLGEKSDRTSDQRPRSKNFLASDPQFSFSGKWFGFGS